MQVPPPQASVKAATGMFVGPVKVELLGVVKSAWNCQRLRELLPIFRKMFGEPAGGYVNPSISDGKRLA